MKEPLKARQTPAQKNERERARPQLCANGKMENCCSWNFHIGINIEASWQKCFLLENLDIIINLNDKFMIKFVTFIVCVHMHADVQLLRASLTLASFKSHRTFFRRAIAWKNVF